MTILPARLVTLALLALASACPSRVDTALEARDAVADAGATVVDAGIVVDAGGAVVAVTDAGPGDVPVVEQLVDAGHIGDGVDTGEGVPPVVKADKEQLTRAVTAIHNRVLVKPKDKGVSPDALEKLASKATGKRVELVRRTAGTFFLLQFAPTSPARTRADQQRLISALQKTGAFTVVEGDQLMTIKN